MAEIQTTILKRDMGSGYTDHATLAYGDMFILAIIESPVILNNNITFTGIYIRPGRGIPFPSTPTHKIANKFKAANVSMVKMGTELWVMIVTHDVDPNHKDAEGKRPIHVEKAVIPNVFPS